MKKTLNLIIVSLMLCLSHGLAEVNISSLFSDGMVFQQGQLAPVWGWADSADKVTVAFKGQTKEAVVGEEGKWMVKLDPLKMSKEPATMIVTVGGETLEINDILVGEVWLCSGQSNMDYDLVSLSKPAREKEYQPVADYLKKETETASDPLLRQIIVPREVSPLVERKNFVGKWQASNPANNKLFSATAYFFARELRKELNVPIGLIKASWGGTRVEAWIPKVGYNEFPDMKAFYSGQIKLLKKQSEDFNKANADADYEMALTNWRVAVKKANVGKGKRPRKPKKMESPENRRTTPSTLYNGLIAPVIPYAIKGAIWYQGESNANMHADEYSKYFMTLIKSWRSIWGQGDFPFYFAQLASCMDATTDPIGDNGWMSVCDEQRKTLVLKNTGMAVLNDVGESKDIHPKNKLDVGKRLSLWALKNDYGKPLNVCSGPLYKSHVIEGNKVVISFDSVGSGLIAATKHLMDAPVESQEPLARFQIKGNDNAWKWAEAKIVGKTVEVSHSSISAPLAVRYAWSSNPTGVKLYNKEGLPASVFKTD